MQSLTADMEQLRHAMETEKESITKGKQTLEEEMARFNEERTRISKVINNSEPVHLSVGGHKFTTTVTTLRNEPAPSFFNVMFSGRHHLKADKDGCYFIDRDGRHFHVILNYLRDRTFNYHSDSPDYRYLMEIKAEAEFYGLLGLVEQIDRFPYNMTKVVRASVVDTDDSWIYEDGHDEIVFSIDKECQLLGTGLCGTDGGFTVELDVYEVSQENFSVTVSTLATCAKSFTKQDGQMLELMLSKPVILVPGKYYMLSALIKGNESHCCEDCMDVVIAGGVKFTFHIWESPNGTNEQRGQFPEIYVRVK